MGSSAEPYAPSTETVKAYFVKGAMDGSDPYRISDLTREEAEAQFMRWFHRHNQRVLEMERDKIWLAISHAFKGVTGRG